MACDCRVHIAGEVPGLKAVVVHYGHTARPQAVDKRVGECRLVNMPESRSREPASMMAKVSG